MIKAILNSWLVLIPVIIYILWLIFNQQKKDVKVRDDYLIRKRRYMFMAIYSTGALIFISLVIFFLQVDATPERVTTPLW